MDSKKSSINMNADSGSLGKQSVTETSGKKDGEELNRGGWGSPVEFVLACLGYAVGLGNVWRFPYLAYRNGGGAFLIPYLIMMMAIGLPIFYLELYVGQYTAVGPIEVFYRIAPGFYGLGYCTLVVITLIIVYYMIIVAWTLYYTFMSFDPDLGWGSCDNDFNTDRCYSGQYDADCKINNTGGVEDQTYYLRTCLKITEICDTWKMEAFNGSFCKNLTTGELELWAPKLDRSLASEEYYKNNVLGSEGATWENYGAIQWHLVGCLALAWVIAFFCVIKGVQSAGKVVYFTALFPYVMLTALLVRGVTLDGAKEGILFYITPEWETLASTSVWGDAASQIFYSFGVGCGSLITLASYNNFRNNCHFDACVVSFANFGTSIFAGFAIFSVLGFQAKNMGVTVNDVAEDGPGLAFVAYPEAILQMPLPQLWAILFFFMLFILGLGSQFAGIEAVNTAIIDNWPHLRKHKWKVTMGTCTFCFILGLPMCFGGGVYLFTLLEWNTASWAILLIGVAECISVGWCYGAKRALSDLSDMGMKLNKVFYGYWWVTWCIISPLVSVFVFVFIMATWQTPRVGDYIFPPWADALGWLIGLSTLAPMIIGFLWVYFKKGIRGKALFTETEQWGPAEPIIRTETDENVEAQTDEGQINEGQVNEGQANEGQVNEGHVNEGHVNEGYM